MVRVRFPHIETRAERMRPRHPAGLRQGPPWPYQTFLAALLIAAALTCEEKHHQVAHHRRCPGTAAGTRRRPCTRHPPAPVHGGQAAEDSAEHWVELVISGDTLTVWVLDENKKPIPGAQLRGKASVLVAVAGKSQAIILSPGDANSLTGKLSAATMGKITTVLSLTVSGNTARARLPSAQ